MTNSQNFLTSFIAGALGAIVILVVSAANPGLFALKSTTPAPLSQNQGTSTKTNVPLTSEESLIIDTVKRTNPAVVSVIISKDVPVARQFFGTTPNDPFGDFFGNNFFSPLRPQTPQPGQGSTQRREIGGGSGFIISADGFIITNRHVVSDQSAQYTVFTNDGKKYDAKVVARDPSNDIGVLKIDANNLPFLEFGDSDKLEVGQTAIAIGNALSEFRNTVSVGVISGLARSITAGDNLGQAEQLDQVIQTDAAINPGNSGGPLLNSAGQVIGVNVAVAQGSQNIGFALPANAVKTVVDSVKKTGHIVRPYIGVRYVAITPQLREQNKLSVDHGVLVTRGDSPDALAVVPGSPADKTGIQEGDIILEADGKVLDDKTSLASLIRSKSVGDTVQLKILHQGTEKTVSVKLEEIPQ